MARKCKISGVSRQSGNRVSHAKNRRRHVFKANIQPKKVFIPEENRTVKLRITTRMIRTIDKIGLRKTLKKHGLTLADIS